MLIETDNSIFLKVMTENILIVLNIFNQYKTKNEFKTLNLELLTNF